MRYAQIREIDIANGPGIRVSLYTQGCHRHCPHCFNQETWDFTGGQLFTKTQEDALIALINRPHIKGFTILGGEPMEKENRKDVALLLKRIKEECPDKSIWMYSSFLFEEIRDFEEHVIDYVDVIVDGPFVQDLKDLNLKFRGSSNQRIVDVPKSLESHSVVLYQFQEI